MTVSRFSAAESKIKSRINASPLDVFKRIDLNNIFAECGSEWSLPKKMSAATFVSKVVAAGILIEYDFPFPHRFEKRYALPSIPVAEVLLSLKPESHFSHVSAAAIHGLGSANEKIVFNFEQREHIRNPLPEQSAIDRAFKGSPRQTTNWIKTDYATITMLNGMYTNLLGVVNRRTSAICGTPANVQVTDIERTLIDLAVRPHYGGGIEQVLESFRLARGLVEGRRLAHYLEQMRFVYPYHQAIGWYMTAAGFRSDQIKPISAIPKLRDFYLTYRIERPIFNSEWRIFIPSEMQG